MSGARQPTNKQWLLPALLLSGVLLRALHLALLYHSPLFSELQWDAGSYDRWAREIAAGDWLGSSAFWQDPLYAYVLGILYRLFGYHLLIPRLLALGCSVVTAACCARTAERVWGSRRAGWFAAFIVSCYLPEIHYGFIVGKTALSVALLAAALDAFTIGSKRALIAAGAFLALGALARGNAVLLLPLALVTLYYGWDRARVDTLPAEPEPRRAGLVLIAALPLLLLATAHNLVVSHEFVPLTTNLGINLYLSNHEGNEDGFYTPPPFLPVDNQNEIASFRTEAERRTGASFTDHELSSYWTTQTWQTVRAHPGHELSLTWHKLQLLLHDDEVSDADSIELTSEWSSVLKLPLITWGMLLPFAVLGAVVGFRRRGVATVMAAALCYLLGLLPFFMLGRLRMPLLAPFSVLAGGGLAWLVQEFESRRVASWRLTASVFVPCLLLGYYRSPWMEHAHRAELALNWNNQGASLLAAGQTDAALRAFERAIAIEPATVPAALRSLGALREQRAEYPQALAAYRQLLQLRPQSPSAQAAVRRLQNRVPSPEPEGLPPLASATPKAEESPRASLSAPSTWLLTPAARTKFAAKLGSIPAGSAAWLLFDGRDAAARALAADLASTLERNQVHVADLREAPVALRPGMSLFAAAEATPTYTTLAAALTAAGFEPRTATGYREFLRDKQREDPNYAGLPLTETQEFVLVVGRQP